MGKRKITSWLFVSVLVSFWSSSYSLSYSQTVKEIIIQNADSILSDKNIAGGANRLLGNVEIIIDQALLTCDSAYYYPNTRVVDAYRNVHINRGDTLQLWGDFLQYDQTDSMMYVRKDVKLQNNDATLYTQQLNYNLKTDIGYYPVKGKIIQEDSELNSRRGAFNTNLNTALFHDSVVIYTSDYTIYSDSLMYNTEKKISYFLDATHMINEENHLKCEYGWYNTQTKIFEITKNAYLENNGRTIEGDSLFYNDSLKYGIARSNVVMTDTSRNALIKGHYAEYYKNPEFAFVTDRAVMVQVMEGDSLFMHADTFQMQLDTIGNRIMYAYHHVKFFKSNIQGKCDSMFYAATDSVLQMHGSPVIWSGLYQANSDYLELFMRDGAMHHMNMVGTAFLSIKEDTARFSQVKGKKMTGYFKDNDLYLMDVKGNGQTVYYLKDEQDYIGVNVSICSNLKIYLKQRKPMVIKNLVKPDATLYPLDQAPKDKLILQHYKWLGHLRPKTKNEIYIWE